MSDQTLVAISQKPLGSILNFFGFTKQGSVPVAVLESLVAIASVFGSRKIDEETGVAIIKSFEDRFGKLDDAHLRVNKFREFISDLHKSTDSKQPFIDSVKSLGLLSKNELEEYAKETGDWSHFLKRSAHDSKLDAMGPEAKV